MTNIINFGTIMGGVMIITGGAVNSGGAGGKP